MSRREKSPFGSRSASNKQLLLLQASQRGGVVMMCKVLTHSRPTVSNDLCRGSRRIYMGGWKVTRSQLLRSLPFRLVRRTNYPTYFIKIVLCLFSGAVPLENSNTLHKNEGLRPKAVACSSIYKRDVFTDCLERWLGSFASHT